jgi:UDP-N-acetylmuramyl pentapeptide phosphotransferase/UDP-N-acetylglucosamine-1-phosphate transferase
LSFLCVFMEDEDSSLLIAIVITVIFGLIGFMDSILKLFRKMRFNRKKVLHRISPGCVRVIN